MTIWIWLVGIGWVLASVGWWVAYREHDERQYWEWLALREVQMRAYWEQEAARRAAAPALVPVTVPDREGPAAIHREADAIVARLWRA